VTDTLILDAMMQVLERNPLTDERMKYLEQQSITVDDKPFYANREITGDNKRYAERVALFHDDLSGPRQERPRRGACDSCGGEVHAVETRITGAMRVDGRCLSCGWELHRAGLVNG
jgi:hypothetical protein